MAVTKTGTTAVKVYNPDCLYITPYAENVKGSTTYRIDDVVRDSTQITQDDAEEQRVESEFSSAPLVNNVTVGAYTFVTDIADYQKTILAELAGFEEDVVSHKLYAPAGYNEVFAEIALVFKKADKTKIACILPKVQLNPKVLLESINSSVGKITINGVGFNVDVQDGDNHHDTPFYVDQDFTDPV